MNKTFLMYIVRKFIIALFVILFWISFIIISLLTVLFWLLRVNTIRKFAMRGKTTSVLFLGALPAGNAGHEYRSKKWIDIFNENGVRARALTIFRLDLNKKFVGESPILSLYLMVFCWKRFLQCFYAFNYDIVVVRREILLYNDYGNMFMEKFLRSINNKMILDFDDNLIVSKSEPRRIGWFGRLMLEDGLKFTHCLGFYKYFVAGSSILRNLIFQHNKGIRASKTVIIPTCVDYEKYEPKSYDSILLSDTPIKFGWIGGTYNLNLLQGIIPALKAVARTISLKLVVVSGEPFHADVDFEIENIPWKLNIDYEHIRQFDIGVMPLPHNELSEGKCGFKLIQYMGMGVVSIASNVGVNGEIISDGVNGFLVNNEDEWEKIILQVLHQKHRFKEIGDNARGKILRYFSFHANTVKYLDYLNFVKKN